MKPSVGRIVHYVSYGTPGGEYAPECRAAIVTAVPENPDKLGRRPPASLAVANPTGMFFNENVPQDEKDHSGGSWHWPEHCASSATGGP